MKNKELFFFDHLPVFVILENVCEQPRSGCDVRRETLVNFQLMFYKSLMESKLFLGFL